MQLLCTSEKFNGRSSSLRSAAAVFLFWCHNFSHCFFAVFPIHPSFRFWHWHETRFLLLSLDTQNSLAKLGYDWQRRKKKFFTIGWVSLHSREDISEVMAKDMRKWSGCHNNGCMFHQTLLWPCLTGGAAAAKEAMLRKTRKINCLEDATNFIIMIWAKGLF